MWTFYSAPLLATARPNFVHSNQTRASFRDRSPLSDVGIDSSDPSIRTPRSRDGQHSRADRSLTLTLERFAWETIDEEAAREGLAIEELITFSVLYYLADIDSGRVSRQISRSPYPRAPDDPPGGGADRGSAPLSAQPISDRR
jgi:hypothetical protein